MDNLAYYLPDTMTHDQEKHIDNISKQFAERKWPKEEIAKFWQQKLTMLSGFCPLEAVCHEKANLAQLAADRILRQFDKAIYDIEDEAHRRQRIIKEVWAKDDSLVEIKLDESSLDES